MWTLTCSGLRPAILATHVLVDPRSGTACGTHTSTPSGLDHAVQFIGSMQACARYGHLVDGLERLRGAPSRRRVAFLAGDDARLVAPARRSARLMPALSKRRVGPVVPLDLQRLARLASPPSSRRPPPRRRRRSAPRASRPARPSPCRRRSSATLPPKTGQRATTATSMPGQLHVDAELRRAVDLLGRVEPLRRLADELEVLRVLELHLGRAPACVAAAATSSP